MAAGDLSAVLQVQRLAYGDAYQEPAEVLDAKRRRSPAACWVACDSAGGMLGYVLAHDWPGEAPPPLHVPLPAVTDARGAFLHDLAVAPVAHGRGVGTALFDAVRQWAQAAGHDALRLVSLADAVGYWRRAGFVDQMPLPATALASYGDGARFMRLTLSR